MAHLPEQPNSPIRLDSFFFRGWFQDVWRWIKKTSDISPVKTASFTATDHVMYPVDTTSGGVTVTLQTCLGNRGRMIVVKKTAGGNNVTVAPTGTDTIEGAGSYVISTIGDSVELRCDGISKWYIQAVGGSSGALASPLTTKGDLWGYSTVNARVPIGTNNYVLTADSTQALGLKWAAMPFMSAGSMFLYAANTSATSGYPGDGDVLWDNATQTAATHLIFAHITRDGLDIDHLYSLVTSGSVLLQDDGNSANYQLWSITGAGVNTNPGTATSYWTFPVTLTSSGGTGTTGFANNLHILVFLRSAGGGGGTPGGANTQVQFNDSGAFGGSANFTWDKASNTLTLGNANTYAMGTGAVLQFAGMANATHSNRPFITSSDANTSGIMNIRPSGTGNTSNWRAYSNSSPTAAQNIGQFAQSGTITIVDANVVNAGTQGTLEIRIGGVAKQSFDTSGNATFAGNTSFTGDIVKIRNVTTTWPAANAAGVLQNDGAGTFSWAALTGTSQCQVYTTGSGNFTVPAGVSLVYVSGIGAGGAGGGISGSATTGAGGGGSGEHGFSIPVVVTPSSTVAYSVGAKGTGVSGGAGNAGAATTFGSLTFAGGNGGVGVLSRTSGAGGGTGGGIAQTSGAGARGTLEAVCSFGGGSGGAGGTGVSGAGQVGAASTFAGGIAGTAASSQSGGGGGAGTPFGAGGAGGNGGVAGTSASGTAYGAGGGGSGGTAGALAGGDGSGGYLLIQWVA